ncbi:MAG: hypothetical protein ACKVKR_09685 [Pseudomonadales bacterium]
MILNGSSADLEGRKYNSHCYTDVKAWTVSQDGGDKSSPHSFEGQDRSEPPNIEFSPLNNDAIPF